MEKPERGGLSNRPELDENNPASLFTYAKARILWDEVQNLSERQLDMNISELAEELQQYVEDRYDEMPRVIVQSQDVTHTEKVTRQGIGSYLVQTALKPYDGDEAVYNEHTLEGQFVRFHQGVGGDLRIFIKSGLDPVVTPGGCYIPYISVGVVDSTIQFEQYANMDKLEAIEQRIYSEMEGAPEDALLLVQKVTLQLRDERMQMLRRLVNAGEIISRLESLKVLSEQALDGILDYVRMQLSLDVPYDIATNFHRDKVEDTPIKSFQPKGKAAFKDSTPQLAIIGGSSSRELALTFMYGDRVIQVPVRHISQLTRVKQQE